MLEPRAKRRLRRNRLSEEANNIEWEHRQEVKLLRAEVERLRRELEAKCVEIQSIRDMEDLAGQEESAGSITTKKELAARVHELEQQVADLKAELLQKEVESEDFGDVASRDLLNHNEDDGRVITNDDLQETQIGEDIIGIPTRLDTPFPSPPPTMPNTPCKPPLSINARIPTSIPSPDSANEALNNQLRSKLRLRGRNGLVNHTAKTADSSIVRLRKEKVGMETQVIGAPKRRQGARFISMLVPEY
jgi:polyhydroxyalkanoate synthesis regulator phasin